MAETVIIVGMSTVLVVLLSAAVLLARYYLLPTGTAAIRLNGTQVLDANEGETLLRTLATSNILLPAACGGRGSCGQCRVTVVSGGGDILPTERSLINRRDASNGVRLACMLTIRGNLEVRIPDDLLVAERITCRVISNENVTTYLKELVLELPGGRDMRFDAGQYVLLEAPPGRTRFADFAIPETFRSAWQRDHLFDLEVERLESTQRAYSIASPPQERGTLRLVVRIATPPPGHPQVPPGLVSSYLFGLTAGDAVAVAGPFGEFGARDSDAEMILIGGGAGIAPLRAIVHDQLESRGTKRRMSLWYGARNRNEICFADEFDALAARHENFSWHVALSDRNADPSWDGPRGLIHAVVRDNCLAEHDAPEDAEYYLCGPPLMSSAVLAMLEDFGVEADSILFDDFGL